MIFVFPDFSIKALFCWHNDWRLASMFISNKEKSYNMVLQWLCTSWLVCLVHCVLTIVQSYFCWASIMIIQYMFCKDLGLFIRFSITEKPHTRTQKHTSMSNTWCKSRWGSLCHFRLEMWCFEKVICTLHDANNKPQHVLWFFIAAIFILIIYGVASDSPNNHAATHGIYSSALLVELLWHFMANLCWTDYFADFFQ